MVRGLAGAGAVPGRAGPRPQAVLHRPAAPERDRGAPHGARPRPHDPGRHRPPEAHAGVRDAVAARDRPRRHRHRGPGPPTAPRGGDRPAGARQGGVHRPGVGLEGAVRRHDRRADEAAGELVRLGPSSVHDGRGAAAGRARGLCPPVRGRADLPGRAHHQLVSHRQDRAVGLRGGAPRGRRRADHVPLPAGRRLRPHRRGHHSDRDDAWRHRRGRAPRRRAVPRAGGEGRAPSVHRGGPPDRGG